MGDGALRLWGCLLRVPRPNALSRIPRVGAHPHLGHVESLELVLGIHPYAHR